MGIMGMRHDGTGSDIPSKEGRTEEPGRLWPNVLQKS